MENPVFYRKFKVDNKVMNKDLQLVTLKVTVTIF